MSQREEWMLEGEGNSGDSPFDFGSLGTKKDPRKENAKAKLEAEKQAIAASRELNPLLRKQTDSAANVTKERPTSASSQSIEWTVVLVKRAVAMIESGEKSYEKAAIDRFGSIEAFEEAIKQVEAYKKVRISIRRPKEEPIKDNLAILRVQKDRELPLSVVEDVNKLMAKKMKAELAGDFEAARRLEDLIINQKQCGAKKDIEKLTLLPGETYNRRKAEKDMSISELANHERLASSKEFDREIERDITGNKRFRDDLETLDEQILVGEDVKSSARTFDVRGRAVEEIKHAERIKKECWFCVDSDRFKAERASDWIVANGSYTYLAIPKTRSIHPLHCLIVPMTHTCSLLDCREFEDEIWEEVRNFKKCLLQMAAKQDRSFVFMECVMKVGDARRHTFIDCVPTPRGCSSEEIKGYFLKALQEADEEWSQNRKVIDTTTKTGGLRGALPRRHFPYFYADFRLDQGYAHVIEDAERFGGGDFGRDLMASVLKVSRSEWRSQRACRSEFEQFCDRFREFDWTETCCKSKK